MAIDAVLIGTRNQNNTATVTTGAGTTTAGTPKAVCFAYDASVTVTSVASNLGGTYLLAAEINAAGSKKAVYVCENAPGGATHTFTVTFSAAAFATVHAIEITGSSANPARDITLTASDASSPWTITSGTLGSSAQVILTLIGHDGGSGATYSSSNTTILSQEPDGGNYWTSAVSKLVVASNASVTPSFTAAGGTNAGLVLVSFKETAGGGGGGSTVNVIWF
jgi:hypothetical protein